MLQFIYDNKAIQSVGNKVFMEMVKRLGNHDKYTLFSLGDDQVVMYNESIKSDRIGVQVATPEGIVFSKEFKDGQEQPIKDLELNFNKNTQEKVEFILNQSYIKNGVDKLGGQHMYKVEHSFDNFKTIDSVGMYSEKDIKALANYYYNNSDIEEGTYNLDNIDDCLELVRFVDRVDGVTHNNNGNHIPRHQITEVTTVFKDDPYYGGDIVLTTEVNSRYSLADVRMVLIPTDLANNPMGGAMVLDLEVEKELCENHEELLELLKTEKYHGRGSSVVVDIITKD